MEKNRLETFSDSVIAIIITIMVFALKVPMGKGYDALPELLPSFASYMLSYLFVAIYWLQHHHLMHMVRHVTGGILWANIHLLFWLSLIPFATNWSGTYHMEALPSALYGLVLLASACAYHLLRHTIIRAQGRDAVLAKALQDNRKEIASMALYLAGIGVSFAHAWLANLIFLMVALLWVAPDRRIEQVLKARMPQS